jgi:hypothetical protein
VDFWSSLSARLRTAITLAVLGVLLISGVAWGLSQVTEPFPGKAELPPCVDTTYTTGDELFPQDVTVSVLNASKREGLAGRTMQLLVDDGFARGQIDNAPQGTSVDSAEIWVSDPANPGAKLVRSRLGKVAVNADQKSPTVGVTVVVGDQFGDLREGAASLVLKEDAVVCSPPVQ